MPTSGENPYWDEVRKQLEGYEPPRFINMGGFVIHFWNGEQRIVCPRCGYDRPASVEACRACQLFKDHAGTVGDAIQYAKDFTVTGMTNHPLTGNPYYAFKTQYILTPEQWHRQERRKAIRGYRAWRRETQAQDSAEVEALLRSIKC